MCNQKLNSAQESRERHLVCTPAIRTIALLLLISIPISVFYRAHVTRQKSVTALSRILDFTAPPGMVPVPGGMFMMGSDSTISEPDEKPVRKVFVRDFYIDQYEVTNSDYHRFDPTHRFSEYQKDIPVTGILRDEAQDYCLSLGKRLPTGSEWEKAARGVDGRLYPWGNEFNAEKANVRSGTLSRTELKAVGSFPMGQSPYGCYDMSGNAWEWVSDEVHAKNFLGISTGLIRGILRGGGYNYSAFQARTSYQGFEDPDLTCNDVGFRCVKEFAER